ncbi:MAG: RlmE family RNA methyltransferase [Alphaproteobacteria bacterium]|nr:RlmE family RNA methyltransferase [Alphaproteobacteria bacterium]
MSRGRGYKKADPYTRRAKAQGYAARSVFKLEEIVERCGLLNPGDRVVDLGCYPGSWSRLASERIEPGALVGVDLSEPQGIPGTFIARSVYEVEPAELLDALGGPADLLMSDMAPPTTGDRKGDHLRQIALAERALWLASAVVRPGGAFIAKVFEGADAQAFFEQVRAGYATARRIKPKATRQQSVEFFVVGQGRQ